MCLSLLHSRREVLACRFDLRDLGGDPRGSYRRVEVNSTIFARWMLWEEVRELYVQTGKW
jgi:hypothetical protein